MLGVSPVRARPAPASTTLSHRSILQQDIIRQLADLLLQQINFPRYGVSNQTF
jgi:hypothetical protein